MLWNGSKPAGLPAFPQSSYLYCFIAILTEIPVLMPHLKLSWQGPGMAERKPGGVWWGQAGWLPARTPAPSPQPGEHAAVLHPLCGACGGVTCHPWDGDRLSGTPGCPSSGMSSQVVHAITLGSSPFWGDYALLWRYKIQPFHSHHRSCQDPWGMWHQPPDSSRLIPCSVAGAQVSCVAGAACLPLSPRRAAISFITLT